MSRLIFRDSYIVVEPSYSDTDIHKHSMLHIFLSYNSMFLLLDAESYTGNIIFLKNNILNKNPVGTINYVFLRRRPDSGPFKLLPSPAEPPPGALFSGISARSRTSLSAVPKIPANEWSP